MRLAVIYLAENERDTARLGQALAEHLPPGSVVALNGPLGAGKTRLVQALAQALGVPPEECVSPTFTLIHEYQGRVPLYHFDAYRLRDEDEFLELGPEEYFACGGISLIEWAERVEACLPEDRVELRLEPVGDTGRRIEIRAFGQRYTGLLERLDQFLSSVQGSGL